MITRPEILEEEDEVSEWQTTDTAPQGIAVETKIDDEGGARNERMLKRRGQLWFTPDDAIYVYYTPTHWRPSPARDQEGE